MRLRQEGIPPRVHEQLRQVEREWHPARHKDTLFAALLSLSAQSLPPSLLCWTPRGSAQARK